MSVDVKECLRRWRRKYGEQKEGKGYGNIYYSIRIDERRHLLIIFLRWMKMLGCEKEEFKTSSFRKHLIDICFGGAPVFDEKKRELGHLALQEELEDVLAVEKPFGKTKSRVVRNSKPLVKKEEISKPAEPRMFGKDVDESLYADLPKPEVAYDEEFAKLIGVDPNE